MRYEHVTVDRSRTSAFVVLVVADDYANMASLAVPLHFSGYEVRLAPDWSTALRVARETSPDVVLLNLTQPDTDQVDLIEQLQKEGRHNHFGGAARPVFVACSPSQDQAARLRSYLAGIDVHLGWPLDVAELRTALVQFHMRDQRGTQRPIRTLHRTRPRLTFRPFRNEGRGARDERRRT